MTYKVGQVIYVVLRREAVVYPVQVVEEITKKTLDGEATTYMIRAGSNPQKVVGVSDVDGELFDTAEAVKATLVDRASASIVERVDQAVAKAREWYPSGFESRASDPLALIMKHDGASGTDARQRPAIRTEVAELAAELQSETASDEAVIELDGGVKARVRSVRLPDALQ